MIGEQIFFAVFGLITLLGGLWSAVAKRTFHAAMGLGIALVGVAAIYVMLEAPLIGVLQVLVYVGGILTLLVFAVMFVAGDEEEEKPATPGRAWLRRTGMVLPIVLFAMLAYTAWMTLPWFETPAGGAEDVDAIANDLFSEHLVAFEVLGVLLTAAMIGALVIARPLVHGLDRDSYAIADADTLAKTQSVSELGASFVYIPVGTPIVEDSPRVRTVADARGEEE